MKFSIFSISVEVTRKRPLIKTDGAVQPRPPVSYPRTPGPIERRAGSLEDMPFKKPRKIEVREG